LDGSDLDLSCGNRDMLLGTLYNLSCLRRVGTNAIEVSVKQRVYLVDLIGCLLTGSTWMKTLTGSAASTITVLIPLVTQQRQQLEILVLGTRATSG
jgi:hypothetical protein